MVHFSPEPRSQPREVKQIVTLTSSATERLCALMHSSSESVYGLRIGLKKGGCAGMEYTMEYAKAPVAGEEIVEQNGARVLISPLAVMFLLGTEIDYETSMLESGFKFRNPNVTESCGCGESIKFSSAADLVQNLTQ